MDIRKVKKLIELLEESGIAEIEIKEGEESVRLARLPQGLYAAPAAPVPYAAAAPGQSRPMPMNSPTEASTGGSARTGNAPGSSPGQALPEGHLVRSPMVGTFYASAEPGARPYAAVGQRVSKGQVVCIIEAMKIMNEIESEYDGVVTAVLAQNAHPVEYGQALYRVDPTG